MVSADYSITKNAKETEYQAVLHKHNKDVALANLRAKWAESKARFNRLDSEKREIKQMKEELEFANAELKSRRNYRLRQLYHTEAREVEHELSNRGLAVRRYYD